MASSAPGHCLPHKHAAALLAALAGPECTGNGTWNARQEVLVAMGGGLPRSLAAMGQACAVHPQGAATDDVRAAVATLAADQRARFRALSPLGQQVVHAIAAAEGPPTPSQLAEQLDAGPRVVATAARRLAAEGVLRSEREGRLVHYEIVDTLFRLWLETVDKPWRQARIHASLQRLEAALGDTARGLDGSAGRITSIPLSGLRGKRHVEGRMLEAALSMGPGRDDVRSAR